MRVGVGWIQQRQRSRVSMIGVRCGLVRTIFVVPSFAANGKLFSELQVVANHISSDRSFIRIQGNILQEGVVDSPWSWVYDAVQPNNALHSGTVHRHAASQTGKTCNSVLAARSKARRLLLCRNGIRPLRRQVGLPEANRLDGYFPARQRKSIAIRCTYAVHYMVLKITWYDIVMSYMVCQTGVSPL